jgi:Protein of unknown function (DUF2612)
MVASGPPYPHPSPAAGSNAVGRFQIGISPIGDIPTFDIWDTVLSQYANSPVITGIITAFNAAMDQTANIDSLFDLIWNVLTAQGYGLDVWGRILGVTRTVAIVAAGAPTFGFNEPGGDWVGFGQAPFFSGSPLLSTVTLTDIQFRPIVLAKAATNVWDGSIEGFNAILLALFQGRGTPWVIDNGNMSITLNFPFALTALDTAIIQSSGCLPQPTGVVINIQHL